MAFCLATSGYTSISGQIGVMAVIYTPTCCELRKKRRKKYGSKDKRGQICNRVSIDQRPDIVDEKSRIGDWEIDTVIGQNHKGALVTIVERKSKFTLIKRVETKHAEGVTEATITLLTPYSDKVFTITADNGKEFAGHETMSKELGASSVFCTSLLVVGAWLE